MADPSSTTVLLLHGFGQSGRLWDPTIEHLSGFDCHAPDIRGHGSAAELRPIDDAALVGDVTALAQALPKPILVGYSMGGRLALRAALAAPDLFAGLVLISTTAGIEDPAERSARQLSDASLASLLEEGQTEAFERAWRALPLWDGDPAWVGEQSAELRSACSPAGLAASLRGFGSGSIPPVWDRLPALELPTAVVAGNRDATYTAVAERLVRQLPVSSLTIVSGCGHSLPIESPAAVAAEIASVSRRPPRAGS